MANDGLALGGARYLGPLEMAGGSPAHVFARDGEAVIVLWNSNGTAESLALGQDVRQTDVYGRRVAVPEGAAARKWPPTACRRS